MTSFQNDLRSHKVAIEHFMENKAIAHFPSNLFKPVHHIMTLEGERLRPLMLLICAQGYDLEQSKAMSAAISIEVFHNFTLLHDDIMDHAKLRRGKITVHEKFGLDKAIVTGDAMLPHAVSLLIKDHSDKAGILLSSFNKMGKEVMEGQQYDMDFENRNDVSVQEYMKMIRLKTAVLFGTACDIGGIISGASAEDRESLYDFGLFSGMALQILDDYLGVFGVDNNTTSVGGDILTNKKSFLLIHALQKANTEQKRQIEKILNETDINIQKLDLQTLCTQMNITKVCLDTIEELHLKSINALMSSSISKQSKDALNFLAKLMLNKA